MCLFFHTQSLQSLIFCIEDQEFVANLDYFFYVFFCNIVIVNHFLYCFIILLHLFFFLCITSSFVPYVYVSIESIDCIILSSLALNAIMLTSLVSPLCLPLLDLCCDLISTYYFL